MSHLNARSLAELDYDNHPDDEGNWLEFTHTWLECRDCPLWHNECDGIAGEGGCFVPNDIAKQCA